MRKANYNIDRVVFKLAGFGMNYIIGGKHGSLDKLYGPKWKECSKDTMNDFLVDYFYGLLAWAVRQPIDIFIGLTNNAIQALVEDLCIEYSPELPIVGTGHKIVSGLLSGGKKRTRKKINKRYRHKKTYSRRRKTKRKSRRRRRRRKSKK